MTWHLPGPSGLTAMVPCYNEIDCIDRCYTEIAREVDRYDDVEILFVDDGSSDGTLERIKAFAAQDDRVKYLSFSRNFGLEAAFTAGFKYASKGWTVQLDADLQSPPAEMHRLVERAREGYDVVFAIRRDRSDAWWRRAGTHAHQVIAAHLLGIEIPLGASVFRVVRTSVAHKIVETRMSTPYFLATAPLLGARYAVEPTDHSPRQGGSGKWRLHHLVMHAVELFVGFSYRPLMALEVTAATLSLALVLALLASLWVGSGPVQVLGAAALAGLLGLQAMTARYLIRVMRVQARTFPGFQVRESNIPVRPEEHLYGYEMQEQMSTHARDTVVVLGGGEDQIPAYREARRLGYRVVGVDLRPDCLGAQLADEFLAITTRDPDRIAGRLDHHRVAAVISPASDAAQEAVAALCDKLGTAHRVPEGAVRASVDKTAFHEVLRALGFATYPAVHGSDRETLRRDAGRLGLPVVVKPTDSSGSKGLTCVTDAAELDAAIVRALDGSPSRTVVIERLVAGSHHTAECFIVGGELAHAAITERTLTGVPHLNSISHVVPAALPEPIVVRVREMIAEVTAHLGLTDGPLNVDFVVTPQADIVLIEMGARLGGNGMPLLSREAFGLNTVEAALRLALGQTPDLRATRQQVAMLHILHVDREGTLIGVDGEQEVRARPEVRLLELFKRPGERVRPYTQANEKLGYLVIVAPTHDELRRVRDEVLATLRWQIAPDLIDLADADEVGEAGPGPADAAALPTHPTRGGIPA